jgi:hypothetical protein
MEASQASIAKASILQVSLGEAHAVIVGSGLFGEYQLPGDLLAWPQFVASVIDKQRQGIDMISSSSGCREYRIDSVPPPRTHVLENTHEVLHGKDVLARR